MSQLSLILQKSGHLFLSDGRIKKLSAGGTACEITEIPPKKYPMHPNKPVKMGWQF